VIPNTARLEKLVGADHIFVVQAFVTRVGAAKKFGLSFGGLKEIAGTACFVAMIDCRSGEIVWADREFFEDVAAFTDSDLSQIVKALTKHLP
jgi:hypothetical protein